MEELTVDDQLGDEDPGPEAQPPQVQGGDADAGGRPDRGN